MANLAAAPDPAATSSAVEAEATPRIDLVLGAPEPLGTAGDERGSLEITRKRRPRIFVADSPPLRARLESMFDIAPSPVDVEAIVSFRTTVVDATMFERAGPLLRLVVNFAVGVDNIDTAEAARRGVAVANTPAVSTADVALEVVP